MNLAQISVTLASAAAVGGGGLLVLRAGSKRIRLLALSVSLLTMCQLGASLSRFAGWEMPILAQSLEILELTAGALSLGVIHLLNRENKERRQIDSRLRVLEPLHLSNGLLRLADHVGKSNYAADKRKALRYRMHAHTTLRLLNSPDTRFACEVRDISESGVGLITGESISLKSEVEIELGGQQIAASVARCQHAGFEFSVGLTFKSGLSRDRVADIVRRAFVGTGPSL